MWGHAGEVGLSGRCCAQSLRRRRARCLGRRHPSPRAEAAPVATTNWTGFYVNGGVGYGLWVADTTVTFLPGGGGNPGQPFPQRQGGKGFRGVAGGGNGWPGLPFPQRQGGKGFLGVAGGGFDYQFAPRLIGGVFADFDFASLKGTVQDAGPFFGGNIKENRAWAVGARGGYLINPGLLSYFNA